MRRPHIVTATLPIAVTLVLAGCGGGSNQAAPKPPDPSTAGGNAARTPTTKVTPGDPKVPAEVPQNLTARKDVTATACGPARGGYQMGGRIKNTLGQKATYKITAVFTDAAATDVGYGTTDVSVPAGATRPWTVTASFKVPSKVICVLRGVEA